jgi:signal transduction histidine kinase
VRIAALLIVVLAAVIVLLAWVLSTLLGQQVLGAVLPAIALLIGLMLVTRLIRGIGGAAAPLGDLVEASGRVESGEMGAQVEVRGPREIRALARAFNSMSARLAEQTDERRRFLADVSHELRTPLTVIQGSVEGMLDGLYPTDRAQLERLLAETRQLERLVEDLRTLSLTDAGALDLRREPVDLGHLVADVVAGFEPQATAAGHDLAVEAADVPTIDLDPRRVRQVLGNLLSNALRHTPPGGSVRVRVDADAGGVVLEVTDTGPGMDAEAAERAFDRFWRAGEGSGAGLGLAIVRDLVRAHGGDVTLDTAPRAGTSVRCHFPRSADR